MLDEGRFWSIIDGSRERANGQPAAKGQDFIDLHEQTLADALRQLGPAEIVAFDERFAAYHRLAYRWDLWAVAYWMHGGCSDDGFIDFRACLISLGREAFFAALDDPDTLADLIGRADTPYMQAEGFQYIAAKVHREKTGEQIRHTSVAGGRQEPAGERIDHDDEDVMRERFPRLLEKMPEMGD